MTRYIFVHPMTAPEGNTTLKAGSFRKAVKKFQRKTPDAIGFKVTSSHDGVVIVHYHGVPSKQ